MKALDIEGIQLTPENVMNGKYPYTWELLLVTKGEPQGKIKEFIDLARSPEGVEIIKKAGYFMHTGGGMGGMHSERMEYTVVGDIVNATSRIEGLSKRVPNSILIGQSTYEIVKEIVQVKEWERVRVRGKEELVQVYEVLGRE